MTKEQRMNVATSLNSKYVRYACVMLTSFLENQPKNVKFHIYFLYNDLTKEDKNKLESTVKAYSAKVYFLLIDKSSFLEFPTTNAWSLEAYYRLALMDVLPGDVERILYLDVDIIVNKSLEELYFTDFGDNVICACKDVWEAPFGDSRDMIFAEQIRNGFTYFCSGVLLLNVKEMRKKYGFKDYMDLARQLDFKMVAPDQDILNFMHWREVKQFDPERYNLFSWVAYTKGIRYKSVLKDVAIVHFSGPKPWSGKGIRYDIEQLWWDYAKMTHFYQELMEECLHEAVHDGGIYSQMVALHAERDSLYKLVSESVKLCEKYKKIIQNQVDLKMKPEVREYGKNKIAFIICANNRLYYDECTWYINHLHIPSGYEIDIICITEAESMAQGYNAAMKDSDAKYKVYLHQDVFIYNKYFIDNLLEIFHADEQIGMIGVIGGIHLPQNADIWDAWNIGRTYVCNYAKAFHVTIENYQKKGCKWLEVEAVDGMLMATQYDIEWREDLMLGWDFYDISQSLEFRRRGYKIAVPFQEEPWCMHDCGPSKLMHYDEIRKNILKEYNDYFSEDFQIKNNVGIYHIQDKIFQMIEKCMEQRRYEEALDISTGISRENICNGDLQYALNILDIYRAEKEQGNGAKSFFADIYTWDEIKNKYDEIKFAVRHAENGTNTEVVESLILKVKGKEISRQAVQIICECSTVNEDWAKERLLGEGYDEDIAIL